MAKICFSLVFALLVAPPHIGSSPAIDGEELYNSTDQSDQSDFSFEGVMPDSCTGKSYCFDKGTKYPHKLIEKLLEDFLILVTSEVVPFKFGEDLMKTFGDRQWNSMGNSKSLAIAKVENPEPRTNSADLCPASSNESPIYYITDTNDKVRVVVQSPNFEQIYSVKWCKNEGRIINDTEYFLEDDVKKFKIKCVTTRMNFDFFVLNDDHKMEIARAKGGIPVCCRCQHDAKYFNDFY